MADNTILNTGTGGDTIRDIDRSFGQTGIVGAKTQALVLDQGGVNTQQESLVSVINPLQVSDQNTVLGQTNDVPTAMFLSGDPSGDFAGYNLFEEWLRGNFIPNVAIPPGGLSTISLQYDAALATGFFNLIPFPGLAGLATSSTLVAGVTSATVDNTVNRFADYLVNGQITTSATTPTANTTIVVYVFAALSVRNGVYTYPVATSTAVTDTPAAATFTANQIGNLKLGAVSAVDALASTTYSFGPFSIAQLFGGIVPPRWGLFVTQSSAQSLASGSFSWTGIKYQNA